MVSVGGGLRSYSAGGRALMDGYEEHEMCSSGRGQVLIPWPNRLRDGRYEFDGRRQQLALSEPELGNAIHGLVRWANWTAVERQDGRVRMEHLLHPQPGYPFALWLAIDYELGPDGLCVRTCATNVGAERCPFGAGAHPYLTAGGQLVDHCTLRAPGRRRLLVDERQIPTGSQPVDGSELDFRSARALGAVRLDTCFCELERGLDGLAHVELIAPDGRGVRLWQDESYPYLMLFSGDTIAVAERRRRGLAAEPMSCPPNAFASGEGLVVLEPGQSFSGSWGIAAL